MGLNPIGNDNWANDVTDLVERGVSVVRDNLTNRAHLVVKGLVYGIVAIVALIILVVLSLLVAFRGLQWLIELGADTATAVWISYIGLGILFSAIGLFLLRRATSPAPRPTR